MVDFGDDLLFAGLAHWVFYQSQFEPKRELEIIERRPHAGRSINDSGHFILRFWILPGDTPFLFWGDVFLQNFGSRPKRKSIQFIAETLSLNAYFVSFPS